MTFDKQSNARRIEVESVVVIIVGDKCMVRGRGNCQKTDENIHRTAGAPIQSRSAAIGVFAVHLEVLGEVVGAREALVAQTARVRADTGVRAAMSGQLVGP